jgi:hypothetical protein
MGLLGVSVIANFLNDFWRASILTSLVADLPFSYIYDLYIGSGSKNVLNGNFLSFRFV